MRICLSNSWKGLLYIGKLVSHLCIMIAYTCILEDIKLSKPGGDKQKAVHSGCFGIGAGGFKAGGIDAVFLGSHLMKWQWVAPPQIRSVNKAACQSAGWRVSSGRQGLLQDS